MSKKLMLKRMLHNPFFVVGSIGILLVFIISFTSPLYMQYDPLASELSNKFQAPEWLSNGFSGHVFGTDNLGRDTFSRLVSGGRYSLIIAACVVTGEVVIGTVLGLLAGYFGGIADTIIMRFCEVVATIPNLILAIAVMAIVGPSITNLIVIFIVTGWVQICKVTRNNVRLMNRREFVLASTALGASKSHIMFKQIFPNVTTNIIILASQSCGSVILGEAGLSFLNLGIQAPTPSWGNMISSGRVYLNTSPWLVFVPSVALAITVLSFNFLGDGLRDVLDPKTRH